MPVENYEPRVLILDRTHAHELNAYAVAAFRKAKTEEERELWREVIGAYQYCCTGDQIRLAASIGYPT